jgi:hypothetical protein
MHDHRRIHASNGSITWMSVVHLGHFRILALHSGLDLRSGCLGCCIEFSYSNHLWVVSYRPRDLRLGLTNAQTALVALGTLILVGKCLYPPGI